MLQRMLLLSRQHHAIAECQFCFQSSFLLMPPGKATENGLCAWIPVTHVQRPSLSVHGHLRGELWDGKGLSPSLSCSAAFQTNESFFLLFFKGILTTRLNIPPQPWVLMAAVSTFFILFCFVEPRLSRSHSQKVRCISQFQLPGLLLGVYARKIKTSTERKARSSFTHHSSNHD